MSREKLANRISDLLNPYYSSSPFFLLVAIGSSKSIGAAIIYWLILTLFFSALPLWDIKRRIRLGLVKDAHISTREDRIKPFIFSLSCAVLGLIAVYLASAPEAIKAISWVVVLTGIVITIITIFWKISLHAAGITSIVLALVFLYGKIAAPIVILVPLVIWARFTLRKHTPTQLAAGTLLAATIVLMVFAHFSLL
ncbi:MAG: hypothetical protein IBX64_02880 [Actinobacteria bacterium]|nr:hypothetical protein [Actinomycetota bacterium]